jgi:hypothetical protein
MVAAVLEEETEVSRQTWRSAQLLRDFQREFTRRGYLFSSRDAATLTRLWETRLAADYGREGLTERRALWCLQESEKLCSRLEKVINNA